MKARDIMTPMPAAVTPADKVWEAAEIMKYAEVGGVPVVSDLVTPRLVGLITDRDITVRCAARRHGAGCEVRDHMTPVPLQTVTPEADVAEIVAKMVRAQVRRIPVVDRDGLLVGIVAEADLAVKLPEREALPVRRGLKAAFRPPLARLRVDRSERGEKMRPTAAAPAATIV
jgi:CBS domain-containing protein